MKNFWITLVSILILLISGIVIGWFWCKSRIKPIIIEKPGETVTITQWKTNTVIVQKPIDNIVTQIIYKDKPIYVYTLIDTTITNLYQYKDFFKENEIETKDFISFNIETKDQIKTYTDTLFNKSYLMHSQNLRVRNFVYKPAPIEIKPKQLTSVFQMYGNVMLIITDDESNNIINNKYTFTPYVGVSGIIAERYKLDIGVSLNSFYGGIGIKFLDWK